MEQSENGLAIRRNKAGSRNRQDRLQWTHLQNEISTVTIIKNILKSDYKKKACNIN